MPHRLTSMLASRSGFCHLHRTAAALPLMLAACSGATDLLLPGDGEPAAIEVIRGDRQSGRIREPLNDPVVVQVSDSRGRPVEGSQVAFALTQAGPGASLVPETATTDADGTASVRLVLGTTTGPQTGEARVVVPDGVKQPTTTFTATALPEDAIGIAAVSGDGQSGPAGSILSQPLVVQVTDAFGNPISGVSVSWSPEGGGSVSEASNTTDAQGQASVLRTLGPTAGPQATIATSEGLAGSPVTFIHTATAGSASVLSIVSGNDQTAAPGTELPGDLVVRLVDAQGNGVPGAAVTWVVGMGGGRVAPENTITDEAGRTASRWTLGPNPGLNRVDAVVSGVGVVQFQAIATSSAPPRLAILTQPPATTRNGAVLSRQPVVQLRDANGSDVSTAGVEITAQLAGGGGELLGTRQLRTDANGRVAFTNLAIAGAEGRRTLVFTAAGYAGATSTLIDVQAISTTTSITGDSPDPSRAGAQVIVSFRVIAEGVIPIGSVTVTDGQDSCTGTLSGGTGSCQLLLTTSGQRTLRATYAGSAGLNGSSDTESHQVDAPPAGNNAPVARFTWTCDGLTCRFTDTSTDGDGSVVSWSWTFGGGGSSSDRNPTHTFPASGTYPVTLVISDDDGAGASTSQNVSVNAPAPPPPAQTRTTITSDEPDPSDPGVAITVSVTVTASTGTPTGVVHVTDENGGGCDIQAPSGSCSYTPTGTDRRTITATFEGNASFAGSSDTEDHTVRRPPDNKAPHADFDVSCDNLTCTFTDRSTDPDGTIVSRHWDYGDGHSETLVGGTASHTYTVEDKYTVTLTVTDDDGATGTRSRDADPKAPPPANQSPTAAFTQDCSGLTCSFDSEQSGDPDGNITNWSWSFGDGGTSNDRNPSHTYGSANTYTVTLTVTDDDGASGTESHPVTVSAPPPPNQAPTAAFSANCTDLSCSFDSGGSSDQDGVIVSRNWDFGDGATSSDANPSHTYNGDGSYNVTLTVTDDDGASNTVTHEVTVSTPNQAPTAALSSSCTDLTCNFGSDGSGDPDGSIASRFWDFGDGSTSNEASASHTYSGAGTYTVTLTVTDDEGASDNATDQVTVPALSPNEAPVARLGSSTCVGMQCEDTDNSTDPDRTESIAS